MGLKCEKCGQSVMNLSTHVCKGSSKSTDDKSGKRVSERATAKRVATGSSGGRTDEAKARESSVLVGAKAHAPPLPAQTGVGSERSSPPETKRGRPRIGVSPAKPWIAAGMSERTWYRRQKDKK